MNRADLTRCALLTVPVAFVVALLSAPAAGWAWAACLLISGIWGGANLWALGFSLEALFIKKDVKTSFIALQIKLVVLFGGLFLLVNLPFFAMSAFLVGFHTVFAVTAVFMLRREGAQQMPPRSKQMNQSEVA